MILLTTLFFEPDWIQKSVQRFKAEPLMFVIRFLSYLHPVNFWKWVSPFQHLEKRPELPTETPATSKWVLAFLSVWFAVQLFLPLRQHLFKGDPAWSGQGQLFAWRMMLTEEVCAIRMRFEVPETKESYYIDLAEYVNPSQLFHVGRSPRELVKFSHFIAEELRTKGKVKDPIIRLEIWKSVNEREPKLLNNIYLNYAKVNQQPFANAWWILPWSPNDEKPTFSKEKFSAWKKFTSENKHQFIDDLR
jgi:vitamin K-dependent gamma-carboxylase